MTYLTIQGLYSNCMLDCMITPLHQVCNYQAYICVVQSCLLIGVGMISSAEVTFELQSDVTADPPQFTLVCHTQGGPATGVVWELDGSVIMEDSSHVLTQTVVDAVTAAYNNTLLVSAREGGEYTCRVTNERGSVESSLTVQGMCMH